MSDLEITIVIAAMAFQFAVGLFFLWKAIRGPQFRQLLKRP